MTKKKGARKKSSKKKKPAKKPAKRKTTRVVFNVEEFAARTPKKRINCVTCREHPKVAKVTHDFMEIKADPKRGSLMSLRDLHRELQTKYGYPISRDAFLRHCKACEAELYEQIEES